MDTYYLIMKYVMWVTVAALVICLLITLKKLLGLAKAAKPITEQAENTKAKMEKTKAQAESFAMQAKKTVSLLSKGITFYLLGKAIFKDYQEAEQSGLVQIGNSTANVMRKRAVNELSKAQLKRIL